MAEEKPLPYKSIKVFYIEKDLTSFLTASLLSFPNRPTWEFTVYGEDKKVAWEGTLRELIETILLGAAYLNKLTLQAKENKPCETRPALTPKTFDTEQAQQGTSATP